MIRLRYRVFHEQPHLFLGGASVVTSAFASTTLPSFLPLLLHLTIVLIYAPKVLSRSPFTGITSLWFGLSIGRSISWFTPSLHTLDTPGISVLVLLGQSFATSAISLTAVLIYARLRTRVSSGLAQLTLFPALWACIWCAAAYISPVGYLTSWSPVNGIEYYDWIIPFVGPAVKDWLVAAWAAICSQMVEEWIMGSQLPEEAPLIPDLDRSPQRKYPRGSAKLILASFLVVLAFPSFFFNDLPLPVISSETTPFTVGCVLPPFQRYKDYNPTLEDYIRESSTLAPHANLLLWPEGAVSFQDEAEREAKLSVVRGRVLGAWVGVSFEETYHDPQGSRGERGIRRTGIALVSSRQNETHFIYYKRHLVPIAESFSLRSSSEPPTIHTLDLQKPNWMKIPKGDWAPAPKFTRPIPVTASICLDLAFPLHSLDSRPALILAPGRTWDVTVAEVMWKQAKLRAHELGSAILWCDGGDRGVSGVAGEGISESVQVGHGSWVRKIALPYPFDEQPTPYGRGGNYLVLILMCLPLVFSLPVASTGFLPGSGIRRVGSALQSFWQRRIRSSELEEDLI
ncbi:hypothetical protein E1B28_000873 [Marasmius oreades]|uniref:CN hydrolase domain-containing protein n=1 Tax=Marasmius oreades TaxID=181124 RepID=A0A9P7V2E2_9AGAR|nr:uncharacterized protein E1B28_000873 [Marasmius oreades]KAG7098987.1 hypothetical protein E1B28_000873 [Marasmius oreades]